jgi:hypothetical protein
MAHKMFSKRILRWLQTHLLTSALACEYDFMPEFHDFRQPEPVFQEESMISGNLSLFFRKKA